MPFIALSTTRRDDCFEADPGLTNQFSFLVIVKDRDLQAVVVGRVVDSEAQLLVPENVSVRNQGYNYAYLPLGCLSAPLVRLCFLRFFTKSRSTVRVLLAHGALVGQIPGAVHDHDQCSYHWAINGHVGEDARRMGAAAESWHVGSLGRHIATNNASLA